MGYSIDSISADCYSNSTCLINKFDIRDEATLAKVEGDIVLLKSSVLLSQPPAGAFDFAQYRAIHKYLFEDIYCSHGVSDHLKQLFWEAIQLGTV